jgi:hypothetical protein
MGVFQENIEKEGIEKTLAGQPKGRPILHPTLSWPEVDPVK